MFTTQHSTVKILFIILLLGVLGFTHSRPVSYLKQEEKKTNPCFLFLSDIHLDTQTDTTTYGNDTGMDLWRNFLAKADSVLGGKEAPQFIVYTGDLPAHYSCNPSCYLAPDDRATHNQNLTTILTGLRTLANKYHKPLFYMPGNNDGLAGDYYSFADENQQTPLSLVPDSSNPFPALNIRPGNKAPCLVSMPHPTMGYYSARPVKDLRLICLNTVIYSKKFTTVDGSQVNTDRQTQMTWLAGQLAEAKLMKEKVYIAMHIPPGTDAYSDKPMWDNGQPSWLNMFLSLTTQYQADISGILYGHTHMDEVRRLYDSTGKHITEVAISCPGVTPQHMNNPGFKTVTYDEESKELMDFTTYYTQLGLNGWGSATYTFDSVFSNKHHHNIYQKLSSMSLHKVGNAVKTIYTVQHQPTPYKSVKEGIDVKWE